MRAHRSVLLAIGCGLALCAAARGSTGPSDVDYCVTPPHPPAGLSVRLSLKNGQTVFREGEIISLVTSYTAQNEHKYIWNSKSYDRSGRNYSESLCIEPHAGRDPLKDYFDSQIATQAGGLFSLNRLDRYPRTAELDLNDYRSLPPGTYRLSVVGYRVKIGSEADTLSLGGNAIPLRSNEVEFTVTEAEPEWQATQMAAAITVLDKRAYMARVPNNEGVAYFDGDERTHAKRVLRFLGTRDSEHEIAVRFADSPNGETTWEFGAGLWASTNRSAVLEDTKAILRSHRGSINEYFVWDLAEMEMYSDPQWRSRLDHRFDDLSKTWDQYLTELNRRVDVYLAEIGMKRKEAPAAVEK